MKVNEMKEGRRKGADEELFLAFQGTLCQRVPPRRTTVPLILDHFALTQWNLLDIIQIPVLLPEILDPGPNITGVYSGLKHIYNPSFVKIRLVVFALSS